MLKKDIYNLSLAVISCSLIKACPQILTQFMKKINSNQIWAILCSIPDPPECVWLVQGHITETDSSDYGGLGSHSLSSEDWKTREAVMQSCLHWRVIQMLCSKFQEHQHLRAGRDCWPNSTIGHSTIPCFLLHPGLHTHILTRGGFSYLVHQHTWYSLPNAPSLT